MRSYRSLAWKELWAQKVMAVLILIALVLSTMMTTVIGASLGIFRTMRESQAAGLNGNRYATLHQISAEQAAVLSADSRVSYVGRMTSLGVSDLPGGKLSILLREYGEGALSAYPNDAQVERGRLPERAGEIALPGDALSLLDFKGKIGDTLTLPVRVSLLRDTRQAYEYACGFVLTGVLKANYVGYVSGSVTGIVGAGTAAAVLPERYRLYSADIRTADKKAFQSTLDDLTARLGIPEEHVQYNDVLLRAAGIAYRAADEADAGGAGFSYLAAAGLLTGALVLLAAGLVIYNIFKIAVAKRVKEYGILRALGAQRAKLYTLVSLQLALLCCAGIPAGVLLGLLSTKGILSAAAGFFNPDLFMAGSQAQVTALIEENAGAGAAPAAISAGITLLSAFLAAMPAARYASKVPPTVAMSGRELKVRRRRRETGRMGSFEAFYARMNMRRSRGRSVITILSLVMSITVYVALSSFSALLDTSASVERMHLGDYAMTSKTAGFSWEDAEKLRGTPGVERVYTLKYSLYQADEAGNWDGVETSFPPRPGETVQIVGVDGDRLAAMASALEKEELQRLKDGAACLVKNPIAVSFGGETLEHTQLARGESIGVNGTRLPVLGELDAPVTVENEGFVNGVQIVVCERLYDELTGQTRYTELYPVLAENADRAAAEAAIQELCRPAGGTWLSYENTDRQLAESYEQIRLLAWGLILFVGLVGILNIVNTVYTNVHTRVNEIGVQRAIGMSAGGLYKTFLWEGVYYGAIAAVAGGAAGYLCTLVINAAAADTLRLTAVPATAIAQAAGLSIAVCLIATCVPLHKIAKMDIVKAIGNIE